MNSSSIVYVPNESGGLITSKSTPFIVTLYYVPLTIEYKLYIQCGSKGKIGLDLGLVIY